MKGPFEESPGLGPEKIADKSVRLGDLTIDLEDRIVRRGDASVVLQEKPFLILRYLLQNPGRVVTREELIDELWTPGLHVDFEQGLNTAVKKLRRALDDSARDPRFLETIPKRGYRLLGVAQPATIDESGGPAGERPKPEDLYVPASSRSRPLAGWAVTAVLVALVSLAALNRPWTEPATETQTALTSTDLAPITESRISLAVMPLRNLDASPEGDYFVAGLTEEIITALGALAPESVRLIASSSTVRFRHTELPADTIGRALGVDYLVTGSLRREHGRSRVSLQVVHAATREQHWSTSYELHGEDVLTMQSRIARSLIRAVPNALWRADPATPGHPPTSSTDAYDTYLKAVYFLNKQTLEGAERAIEYFGQAIEIDPDFSSALSAVGKAWLIAVQFGARPTDTELEQILDNAARGVELAPGSALSHMVQGGLKLVFERDWQTSKASLQRALEIDPGHSGAHEAWAWWLLARGRHQEAEKTMELVRELDPVTPRVLKNLGWFRYHAGHYAEAVEPCAKALELEPAILAAAECLHRAESRLGHYDVAAQRVVQLLGSLGAEATVETSGEAGYRALTDRLLQELLARGYGQIRPFDVASRFALASDAEQAVAWLERAEQLGDPEILLLSSTTDLVPLRTDSRVSALAQRLNLL